MASPSSQHPTFNVRMPGDLRERIAQRAERNSRSMNTEIVLMLKAALGDEPLLEEPTPQSAVVSLLTEQTKLLREIAEQAKTFLEIAEINSR